ncbi:hypothetical protein [Burkholderia ubonensis]|uniref:hypothetical protein n=1 Tax=Burkholderia ubonensis TaxID=101571 RepID=UPI0012F74571|nr:hypothetical protein [Burkholderia ubonensis]
MKVSRISQAFYMIIFIIIGAALPAIIFPGLLPSVVYMTHDKTVPLLDNLSQAYFLLPDDVMITMRVARHFFNYGIPAINNTDVAQAATSYLMPLMLAPLFAFVGDNGAVVITAMLGALSVGVTAWLIVQRGGRSAELIAIAFLFNATTLTYLYSGWEPLFQAAFVAVFYVIAQRQRWPILLGIIGALGVLARADAIFLVVPIFVYLFYRRDSRQYAAQAFGAFALIGAIYAGFQLHWFHTITPTTARLKAGTLPSFNYSFEYWWRTVLAGSASGLIPLLIMARLRSVLAARPLALVSLVGVLISYIYCFLVSDVFSAGRMYLGPLALTAVVLATLPTPEKRSSLVLIEWVAGLCALSAVLVALFNAPKNSLADQIEMPLIKMKTAAGDQVAIASYIREKFKPTDGAIGLFYLGTGYELPGFEVADFLGKADEMIARGPVKWGPPGHNKWDIEKTLAKWRPAVIPLTVGIVIQKREELAGQLARRENFSFWNDLYLNSTIESGYTFCVPYTTIWTGILVRNDLYPRIAGSCQKIR